jgi:hypothetical protein
VDVNALRDLVQRLNPERRDNPHRGLWFKPSEEPTVLRILPSPHINEDLPFFTVFSHYDIAGLKSVHCPKQLDGSPCPICDLADDFRSRSGKGRDDPNFKIFLDLQAKARIYTSVLIRGREEEGPKLWGFPGSILKYFFDMAQDPDWGDFTNPTSGRDVAVQLLPPHTTANPGNYPRPAAKLKPVATPIFKDKDLIKELIASVPNYLELDPPVFEFKSYDDLVDLVKKHYADEDEDGTTVSADSDLPTFDNTEDKPKAAPASSDDDLNSKLDDLLGD